jgi:hypothetical protein
MDEHQSPAAVADRPDLAAARSFLEALSGQDYRRLAGSLAPQVRLRALLPGGPREWVGAAAVADRFAGWFGDTQQHELLERAVGEVSGRIRLRWRLRLQAERLGAGWFVVEQQAYADPDGHGRIAVLDLVCTGYRPEGGDG